MRLTGVVRPFLPPARASPLLLPSLADATISSPSSGLLLALGMGRRRPSPSSGRRRRRSPSFPKPRSPPPSPASPAVDDEEPVKLLAGPHPPLVEVLVLLAGPFFGRLRCGPLRQGVGLLHGRGEEKNHNRFFLVKTRK
ncbi:hypothetical protein BRADI_1g66436v3 [Brachypodium distachyon]|uniref:Uncharacterized protein n=1 Tax=Brachypodium distachyon TaxID=15368 RepID=A0A2K2DTR7_BRADI|nr:hypothetical protein BRADI_1g66436v3 [Brachypodium distachyon]